MELYEIIALYAEDMGIEKFEAGDMTPETMAWATEYAVNYRGDFSFMVDMKMNAQAGSLSKGQCKGVLNCALAESRYRKPKQQEVVVEETQIERVVPNGTYTVVFPDQSYRTLRVKDDFRKDAPEGGQMVEYLSGPDNEQDFTGFAFLAGSELAVWTRFRQDSELVAAVHLLLEDYETAGHAYAIESGRCYHCGRPLTVPDSLHRGLGPVCAANLGVA